MTTVADTTVGSQPIGAFGRMAEASPGKDSVTGHWELAGLVLDRPFPVFPHGFPADVMTAFEKRIGRSTLGNKAASGTAIIDELGPEHVRTGNADRLHVRRQRLSDRGARRRHSARGALSSSARLRSTSSPGVWASGASSRGRSSARPARSSGPPTASDFALTPFAPTLLDALTGAGIAVTAIGKIEDLFAGRGISSAVHTTSDDHGMDEIVRALDSTPPGLIFANLVDFDTEYGHRNDPPGYAANLERFDVRLASFLPRLGPRDLLIVTADHGNDPTTPSTDHSREHVPLFVMGSQVRARRRSRRAPHVRGPGADGRRPVFRGTAEARNELPGCGADLSAASGFSRTCPASGFSRTCSL